MADRDFPDRQAGVLRITFGLGKSAQVAIHPGHHTRAALTEPVRSAEAATLLVLVAALAVLRAVLRRVVRGGSGGAGQRQQATGGDPAQPNERTPSRRPARQGPGNSIDARGVLELCIVHDSLPLRAFDAGG